MQSSNKALALVCSDLHLSITPPGIRADWMEGQIATLKKISDLSEELGVPVIIAGDIFDQWNSSSELVNFAFKHLPHDCYAIPGQHDLPYHNTSDVLKSSYGTLVLSGRITEIGYAKTKDGYNITKLVKHKNSSLCLWGFPWRSELFRLPERFRDNGCVHMAVAHRYVWCKGNGFPGAPEDHRIGKTLKSLRFFDLAVFGDNHKGFQWSNKDSEKNYPFLWNNGSVFRRSVDQISYTPRIGIVYADRIEPYSVLRNEDKFITKDNLEITVESEESIKAFIASISNDKGSYVDYRQAVKEYLVKTGLLGSNESTSQVATMILDSIKRAK